MPNFKIKLKLKQLSGSFLMDIQGKTTSKKCLCIPVEDNHLFISEKSGEVYLDLIAFEAQSQYGSTHIVKRSLSKEEHDSLTEEQRKTMPILGSVEPLGQQHQPNPQPQAADPYPNPQPSQQYEGDLLF